MKHSYPWKVPRNTVVDLFCLLDGTLKPAVGEGVQFVEIQVSFVGKEALPSCREDVMDFVVGDHSGREVDEVFTSRLQLDALLHHHWELCGLAYEHTKCVVFLFQSAKGHHV